MSDTTIRTAPEPSSDVKSTPVESKNPDRPTPDSGVQEPPIHYKELKGHPYSAEHFDMVNHWNDPDLSFKDSFEAIDGYYGDLVRSGEIQDGVDSYKDMMKRLYKEVGLDKNAAKHVAVAKIHEYVKFRSKIKDIEKNARRYGSN